MPRKRVKMKVKFKRGQTQFVVEEAGSFFLVNISNGEVIEAKPHDKPDMFLKFGYFEEEDTLTLTESNKIRELMASRLKTKKNI